MKAANPEKPSINLRCSIDFKQTLIERARAHDVTITAYIKSLVIADHERGNHHE